MRQHILLRLIQLHLMLIFQLVMEVILLLERQVIVALVLVDSIGLVEVGLVHLEHQFLNLLMLLLLMEYMHSMQKMQLETKIIDKQHLLILDVVQKRVEQKITTIQIVLQSMLIFLFIIGVMILEIVVEVLIRENMILNNIHAFVIWIKRMEVIVLILLKM